MNAKTYNRRRISSSKSNILADLNDMESEFEVVNYMKKVFDEHGKPELYEKFCEEVDNSDDVPGVVAEKYINKIFNSRRISSSQKGFENVAEGTQYDDYHIDTTGMGILDVEHIINEIEGRGNQAVLTVKTSDGATQHTQFNAKDWKAYKDAVNGVDEFSRNSRTKGAAITDVWVTEVEGGSYVRNSRRPVKSSVRWSNDDYIVETFEEYGNGEFYVCDKDTDGKRFCKTFWSEKDAVEWAKNNPLKKVNSSRHIKSARRPIKSGKVQKAVRELEKYFEQDADGDNTIYTYKLSPEDEIYIANICDEYGVDFAVGTSHVTVYPLESSRRPVKSARYIATDPESGEVLGSADTYEEAVNEWGEDVTITDSEAAEGQQEDMGLFQSRKSIKSDLNVNDEAAYWDGMEDGVNGLNPADEDDPDYMKGWKAGKARLKSMNIQDYNIDSSRRPIKSSLHTEVVENFPEYMVFYAVYGESGYGEDGVDDVTDEDIKLYEEWRERNGYGTCFGTGSIYDESYFSSNPAFGLPCTVIPVVFEVSNSVTSSKKPETTKQFVTRILSELETGEITEDEAAEEIAEANDVNIGYARQILSSYIADKDRYITSGMLELGDALNVEFDPDGNLDSWSVDFATDPEKPAPTLGGELVRAARYIISAFRDNDEKVGWGYAREVLNPAARFIVENTDYKQNDVFEDLLDGQTYNDDAYRQFIDMFETDFADYLRDHEELFHKLNKKNFEENTSESDEYSSVDEIIITDDEGNEYLFKYDGDNYVCYGIDEGYSPEYLEGDVLTPEDYPYDNVDFNEEFGEFEQDGFIYSWEDGDGESIRISDVSLTHPMFDYDDILNSEEVVNLIENGTEVYDINHNELKVSDIM